MRKDIKLQTISSDAVDRRSGRAATIAFSLSYDGRDPETVQRVSNQLATLYLEENLKARTEQSEGASRFLQDEANTMQQRLAGLDAKIAAFKGRNIDALPELTQVNYQSMDRVGVAGAPGRRACRGPWSARPGRSEPTRRVLPVEPPRSDLSEWQARLRDLLPAYMVPSVLCPVEAFPVTAQGKIDRRRLADLAVGDDIRPDHVVPVTPTEKLVVAAFERRFGIARVGLRDNFFELGGHSLMAIQITAELGQSLGKKSPSAISSRPPMSVRWLRCWTTNRRTDW